MWRSSPYLYKRRFLLLVMRVQINTNGIYDYLTTSPQSDLEDWKTKDMKLPRPFVNLSFGDAELSLPLSNMEIKFLGNGINYSTHAIIYSAQTIDCRRLSLKLIEEMPKGYQWKAIGENRIGAYIYNGNEMSPSFAFSGGTISGRTRQHVFVFHMGAHGARARELGSEAAFVEEVSSFQDVVSYFVNSCFALRRKIKKPASKVEIPSLLELTCLDASYSL